MDKPRHPQVIRTWKLERLKQRAPDQTPRKDKAGRRRRKPR